MHKLTKKSLTIGAILGTTALTAFPAHAQLATGLTPPPVVQTVDQNEVDLQTGKLAKVLASISIGSGGPGSLGFDWTTDNSKQWPVVGYVHTTFTPEYQGGPIDTHYSVTIGGSTETFTQLGGSGPITQDQGRPSTFNGSTYTGADGTVAVFGSTFQEGLDSNGLAIMDSPISTLTYPTGEKLNYYWNFYASNAANLTATTSNLGYQLRLIWSSATQISSAVVFNMNSENCDPTATSCTLTGNWPTLTWDAVNKRVVDNTGRWVGYTTDGSGNQVITYPSGRTITYGNGTYNDGRATTTYTVSHSFTSTVGTANYFENGVHTTTRVAAFSNGLPTSGTVADAVNQTSLATNYTYDSNNRVSQITHPDGTKTQYGYDSRGNLQTTTQISSTPGTPANIVTSAVYPSTCTTSTIKTCNKPTSTTDASGNVTNYTYDTNSGQALTVTSPSAPNGIHPQTRYTYAQFSANYHNGSGQIVSGSPVWLLTSTSQCQTQSSCTGTADEVKSTVTYDPNQALLPISASSGSGDGLLTATTAFTYTGNGDVKTVDGSLSGSSDTSRFYYDPSGWFLGSIGPLPGNGQPRRAVRTTYDNDGRPTTIDIGTASGQGDSDLTNMTSVQQEVTTYDGQSRITTVSAKAGGTTYSLIQDSYSDAGVLQCTAVRMNPAVYASLPASACTLGTQGSYGPDRITSIAHDNYFRTTTITNGYGTSAASTDVTNTYNSIGQLASVTDANNHVTSYTYDGMGRPIKTTYPGGGNEQVTLYDANGNAKTLLNRAGQSISLSYDALNRLTSKSGAVPTVNYTYDNLGRVLTATFATGGQGMTNAYDALSRVTSSSSNMGGTARQFSYQYDLAGRRTQMTYPDGYYLNYDYLTTGEVQKIRANGATTGINVLATYAYDALGNRSSLTLGNGVVTGYGYDPVSRLTSLTHDLAGTANDLTRTFTYNPASGLASVTSNNDSYAWNGAVNVARGYTPNSLNQYASVAGTSFTHDTDGNLTSDGTNTFGYDAENKLTSATVGGGAATLSYDPAGRLWDVVKGSSDTRFFYDGPNMAAHYDSSGTLQYRYVFGPADDEPLLQYNPSGVRTWYTADERGSIVSDSDDTGTFALANTYDESGIPGSANSGRFQYTGQMWVPELGMYFYKARAYSPTLGRFMQTDPIGYGDGMNWYAYVHNDPVNGSDPSGLDGPPGGCGFDPRADCTPIDVTGTSIFGLIGGGGFGGSSSGGGGSDADALTKLTAKLGELCAKGLSESGQNMAGVNRAKAVWPLLQKEAISAGITTALLASVGVKETDFFPELQNQHPNAAGTAAVGPVRGLGAGIFQIDRGEHPKVSIAQAMNTSFSAHFTAQELGDNMRSISRRFPNFSALQLLQATAASHNLGPNGFSGNPATIDNHSRGKPAGHYGENALHIMACFYGMH